MYLTIHFSKILFIYFFPLGAHGVGRRHIKNTLITSHPNKFAYPIPRKYILLSHIDEQHKTGGGTG